MICKPKLGSVLSASTITLMMICFGFIIGAPRAYAVRRAPGHNRRFGKDWERSKLARMVSGIYKSFGRAKALREAHQRPLEAPGYMDA